MDLTQNTYYIEYKHNLEKQLKQENLLNNHYNKLKKNNYQINYLLNDFTTLNSAYKDESLKVTYNYYNYIVLLFVSVLLLLLFFRFTQQQTGGSKQNYLGSNILKFSIFFITIFLFLMIVKIFNKMNKNQ